MSDGCGVSGSGSENDRNKKLAGDEFGRAVARVAVAQICECAGFQGSQKSALDALSDIAIRYLCDLGKTSHFYANLAGRTDSNIFDVVHGLEDLFGSAQGFLGASDVNRSPLVSGTVWELNQYVRTAEEIPFARDVPHFPIITCKRVTPSFIHLGEQPPAKHIPSWLPAFPDPHTYMHTEVWNERTPDPKMDKIQQAKQRRKAESSLLNLQLRLADNAVGQVPVEPVDSDKGKQVADGNPFLLPPLPSEDKDISPLALPEKFSRGLSVKKEISVLETFAPAIEAAKSGACEIVEGQRTILPNKRKMVHFKIGADKKSVASFLVSSRQHVDARRAATRFGRDDEKDDKKRRAEQILKQAMEHLQELPQL